MLCLVQSGFRMSETLGVIIDLLIVAYNTGEAHIQCPQYKTLLKDLYANKYPIISAEAFFGLL